MAENKMGEATKILGLEFEEEFNTTSNKLLYKITKDGIYRRLSDNFWCKSYLLSYLVAGNVGIITPQWKPKMSDDYFAIEGNIDYGVSICRYTWCNKITDIALYSMGNCFNTIEEAEKHKEEIINKTKDIMGRC